MEVNAPPFIWPFGPPILNNHVFCYATYRELRYHRSSAESHWTTRRLCEGVAHCIEVNSTLRLLSVSKLRELSCDPSPKNTSVCQLQKVKKKKNRQLNIKSAPKHRHQQINGQVPHPFRERASLLVPSERHKQIQSSRLTRARLNCSSRELWGSGLVWRH